MKLTNIMIIFLIILLPIIAIGDLKYEAYTHAESLKKRYDVILEKAVHDGAAAMVSNYIKSTEGIDQTVCVNPMQGINQFLETMGVNLGIESSVRRQELLFYIPSIIVIDYDGIYLYGVELMTDAEGNNVYQHILKPKTFFTTIIDNDILTFHMNGEVVVFNTLTQVQLLYTLEETQALPEFTAYPLDNIKKKVIATTVEKALNHQVNSHNSMAHQNGIAYTFYIPQINEEELQNAFDDVGMIAFFQGMPLGGSQRLNLYALGGSRLFKKSAYYGYTRNSVRYVCESGCVENLGVDPECVFHTLQEAAEGGYFPCQTCKP